MDNLKQWYGSYQMKPGSIGYSPSGRVDWTGVLTFGFRVAIGGFAVAFLMLMVVMVVGTGDDTQAWMGVIGAALILYVCLSWVWDDAVFVFGAILMVMVAAPLTLATVFINPHEAHTVFEEILMLAWFTGLVVTIPLYVARLVINMISAKFPGTRRTMKPLWKRRPPPIYLTQTLILLISVASGLAGFFGVVTLMVRGRPEAAGALAFIFIGYGAYCARVYYTMPKNYEQERLRYEERMKDLNWLQDQLTQEDLYIDALSHLARERDPEFARLLAVVRQNTQGLANGNFESLLTKRSQYYEELTGIIQGMNGHLERETTQ